MIGLATVTLLWAGTIGHRDTLGSVQDIHPGDVNWMTAGRGIAHSERTPSVLREGEHPPHGLQAWVAVPLTHVVLLDPGSRPRLRALTPLKATLLGGEPLDGPRHLWWNFVSSSRERIEQAKQDWLQGRFGQIPGDDEFIPLPER